MTSDTTNVKLVILRLFTLVLSDDESILGPEGARDACNKDHHTRGSESHKTRDNLVPLQISILSHTRQALAQAPGDIMIHPVNKFGNRVNWTRPGRNINREGTNPICAGIPGNLEGMVPNARAEGGRGMLLSVSVTASANVAWTDCRLSSCVGSRRYL
jgi:hypothetical protein